MPAKKTAKKPPSRKATPSPARRSVTKVTRTSTGSTQGRRGDHIVIDSPQVGTLPREGEVLKVIVGDVGVSYRVRWADGHETLISPVAGSARFLRT